MRIALNRDKIATRIDRVDPYWMQSLDYSEDILKAVNPLELKTIDFDLCTGRKPNEVHSQYPIRQSLKKSVPANN